MRPWWWVTAVVLLTAACGGGSSDGDTAEGDAEATVESADGLAAVSFQPGSLPEGVLLEDIQVEVIVNDTDEPAVPVVAVQLLPDGLVLAEPATVTIALPAALEGGFMAIHMSGDSIEFLDGDIQPADQGFSFSTSVRHFSLIGLWSQLFETLLSVNPEQVSVGQTQHAAATITAKVGPISRWFRFSSDERGTARLFRFSAPQPPIFHENAEIHWNPSTRSEVLIPVEHPSGLWDPEVAQPVEITKTPTGWETSSASSSCLKPNAAIVQFRSKVSFNLTLLSRGEPAFHDFLSFFSQTLSAELGDPHDSIGASADRVALLDLSPGDTFQAKAFLVRGGLAPCSGAKDSTTTSSTTTTEAVSGSGTTTTTQPPAPESLQAVVPTSVVSVVNDRTVEIEIEFPDGARAVAEGLHRFDVTIHVFGEGLRVTGNVISTDGETLVNGRSVLDGEPTEDGKGTTTVTKGAQVEWEWRDDHFFMTITTEDVTVPGTAPQVAVVVQETPDTEVFTFNA